MAGSNVLAHASFPFYFYTSFGSRVPHYPSSTQAIFQSSPVFRPQTHRDAGFPIEQTVPVDEDESLGWEDKIHAKPRCRKIAIEVDATQ